MHDDSRCILGVVFVGSFLCTNFVLTAVRLFPHSVEYLRLAILLCRVSGKGKTSADMLMCSHSSFLLSLSPLSVSILILIEPKM